ncbi:uncharacterized protein LOC134203323, partial [Armigeres subalbatus]|uniref:uncharacterized protein LOC134203323 n=1 Tax=Armigeres subalbatus TaxID=124917 RepID=UPI002ED354B1
MEVKRVRVTNRKQFNLLVTQMEAQPAVARGLKFCEASGINRNSYDDMWRDLTVRLNSLGPPTRTEKDRQKVWTDYKNSIKNKLAHNKREANATGGGPNAMKILSPMEEVVVKLLSLDKMINHAGTSYGLPRRESPQAKSPPTSQPERHQHTTFGSPLLSSTLQGHLPNNEVEEAEETVDIEKTVNRSSKRKRRNTDTRDDRLDLLVEQTENIKKIVEYTGEIARYTRKSYKLREDEARQRIESELRKEKARKDELEYNKQLLQYKKRKLDILE